MADIFRTLIVPAEHVELARSIAAAFGPGGEGMWTTPLAPENSNTATHYISSGFIPEEFAYMVPNQIWEWVIPEGDGVDGSWQKTGEETGNPVAVYNLAVEKEIDCTQAQIDSLFATADVTQQEPFVAMKRLGVQILQPNIDV